MKHFTQLIPLFNAFKAYLKQETNRSLSPRLCEYLWICWFYQHLVKGISLKVVYNRISNFWVGQWLKSNYYVCRILIQ